MAPRFSPVASLETTLLSEFLMSHRLPVAILLTATALQLSGQPVNAQTDIATSAAQLQVEKGIVAVLGFSEADAAAVVKLAANGGPRIYFQSGNADAVKASSHWRSAAHGCESNQARSALAN